MTIYKKTVGETRTLRWEISPDIYEEEIKHHFSLGILKNAPRFEEVMTKDLLTEVGAADFDSFIKNKVEPVFPLGMTYENWKKKAMEQQV